MAAGSEMPFGHAPTPSFHAASIMFCAARPASKETGPLPATISPTTSAAPRTLSAAHTASAAPGAGVGRPPRLGRPLDRLAPLEHDEPPGLLVARAAGHAARLEDAPLD